MQYYARPSLFKPSHVHTDVRLVLGWTSSLIALGASGYAYKVPFQESRSWVLAALITFVFLSAVMAAYSKWVERDTVFIGRRKVYAGRVSLFEYYYYNNSHAELLWESDRDADYHCTLVVRSVYPNLRSPSLVPPLEQRREDAHQDKRKDAASPF